MSRYLTNLAGANFRAPDARELVYQLQVGETTFRLEREGSNAYDPNAIKIQYIDNDGDEWFIGYCEKVMNTDLAAEMDDHYGDEDWPITVTCKAVHPNEPGKNNPGLRPLFEILTGDDAR